MPDRFIVIQTGEPDFCQIYEYDKPNGPDQWLYKQWDRSILFKSREAAEQKVRELVDD